MRVAVWAFSSAMGIAAAVASAQSLPPAPVTISPAGRITDATPVYVWTPIAGTTAYALRVDSSTGTILHQTVDPAAACTATTCSLTPSLPLPDGSYRWLVRAANEAGLGPWGSRRFSVRATATPTPTPTLTPAVTPTPTLTPTATPTPRPTQTPRPTATVAPTATPITRPTATPTTAPTASPTPFVRGLTFVTTLTPENGAITNASGTSTLVLSADERAALVSASFTGLTSTQTAAHVHGPADPGQTAGALFSVPMGNFQDAVWVFQPTGNLTVQQQVDALKAGRIYINIHSANYPNGEIRGHYRNASTPTPTPTGGPTATPTPTPAGGLPTEAEAVRFLQQASWGADAESVARVRALGYEAWIDEQMALPMSTYSDHVQAAPTTMDDARLRTFQARFFGNAMSAPDQLRQRVGWALSQILVVSGVTIYDGAGMAYYVDMLNRNAFGRYRQLLHEVTLNPAMGDYLDMVNNVRPNPTTGRIANENYAREILQLFSIGVFRLNPDGSLVLDAQGRPIPTYDQAVIENLARVFTGWTYAPLPGAAMQPRNPRNYLAPMVLYQPNHDVGTKTILNGVVLPSGRDGNVDLSDALNVIAGHPNVGPFIGRQLIQHLVTSNPSPAYVARVTAVFNDNGAGVRGDLGAVVKSILLDPEARTAGAAATAYGKLKEPVLAMLQLIRALEGVGDGLGLAGMARDMGQNPFLAPTVFSYYQPDYQLPGTPFIAPPFQIHNEATTVVRSNWVNTLIFGTVALPYGPVGTTVTVDLAPYDALASDPAALVSLLDRQLLHGTMSASMRSVIVGAVGQINPLRPRSRVQAAIYLVATSAQFNVGR